MSKNKPLKGDQLAIDETATRCTPRQLRSHLGNERFTEQESLKLSKQNTSSRRRVLGD